MLTYPDELRKRLAALVEDVEPLHTVSAVGFSDSNRALVEDNLKRLAEQRSWAYLDLRQASPADAARLLRAHWQDRVLVVAAASATVPMPLLNVVRAFVDRADEVALGDQVLPRRGDQSVFLVCDGCEAFAGLSRELQRIPYWDFVP